MKGKLILILIILILIAIFWIAISTKNKSQIEPQWVDETRTYVEPFEYEKASRVEKEKWCIENPGECKGYDI